MIFGKYINRYYLKNAPVLLLGLLALLTVDYIQLLIPQFYRLVINGVNLGQVVVNGQTLPFTKEVLLQHICLPMIWIVVLMVIGRFLWRICFFGSAVRVAANLRERMFDHSRQLSQQYYQVNKVGNLMSLYTNDIDTIQECFGDGILMFFDALVLGLMALYKMWRMDYKLTLLALIPALIMFGIGTVMGTAMTKRWEERQQAFSDLSDFAQENFSGIAVIKAFVKELKELMAFRKLNKQNEEINVIYTKIATLLEVLVTLFVESVICVILGYGGYLVYQGRFNAGQLVEYIGYFEAIVWPIMAISMLIEKTSRGKASLNRITELLNAPIDVADRPGVQELQNPQGSVEFRHLTFRYPDGEYDVLQDISFTIHPGESVGIVGKTGAGKTALVDLLLRTYNVPDGTLFVDGKDVNTLSIHSALVSSSKARLETLAGKGNKSARGVLKQLEEPEKFLSTIQIGITLIGIVSGAYGGVAIADDLVPLFSLIPGAEAYARNLAMITTVVIITYLSLIIGELVPKSIALSNPERYATLFSPIMILLTKVSYPFVWFLSISTRLLNRIIGVKNEERPMTQEEIKMILHQSSEQGVIDKEETEMLRDVFRFSDKRANELMTHRRDLVIFHPDDTKDKVMKTIEEEHYSKYLLVDERKDEIIGVVSVKDIILMVGNKKEFNLREIARPALFIPESLYANKILELFKKNKNKFGVVVNEYGSTEGIITLHDLTESIFGDILEEDDTEEEDIVRRQDGSMLVEASMNIKDFMEEMGILSYEDLEDEDFTTLGGLAMFLLGGIPKAGDIFTYKNLQFEVVDMDRGRVDKLLVIKRDEEE